MMNRAPLSLEQLINTSYVKYDVLTKLINQELGNSSAEEIYIIIDLNSVIKSLNTANLNNIAINPYKYDLAACIVNMIAHYRRFFKTRYAVYSHFHLVFNPGNETDSGKICYGYHTPNIQYHDMKTYVYNNIMALNEVLAHISDCCITICNAETGAIIKGIDTNDDIPTMLISKDIYNYQLLRNNLIDFILVPRKYKGEDSSYIVNHSNVGIYFAEKRNITTPYQFNFLENYSLLLSMTMMPERNLKSLVSMNKAVEYLNAAINNGNMVDKHLNSINDKLDVLIGMFPILGKYYTEINNRYRVIDIDLQYDRLLSRPDFLISYPKNYYDMKTLESLLNSYFKGTIIKTEDL